MRASEVEVIAEGLQFPEGPIYASDGSVILVEIRAGRLTRVRVSDGQTSTVAECGGGPNGAAVTADGRIIVCNNGGFSWEVGADNRIATLRPEDYQGGSIQMVDPKTRVVETIFTQSGDHRLPGPSDVVVDSVGGTWITDAGKRWHRSLEMGAVHYITPDGKTIREELFPLIQPNGIGFSPEGDRLYVAETAPGRLWWWPVIGHGELDKSGPGPAGGRLLIGLDGFQPLDSLAIDAEGNVCIGTLRSGVISVVSPEGALVDQVSLPVHDDFVTSICFGGSDMRTAFITSSGVGRLYALEWPCPGAALAFNL